MTDYQSISITDEFKVEIYPESPSWKLTDLEKESVELIWSKERIQRPNNLFNGLVLSVIEFDDQRVIGAFIEYKYLIAQYREPSLKKTLNITPVCVSALTHADGHILLARRSTLVTQHPNSYECVPSGGIDPHSIREGRIDIKHQIYQELEEEANLKNPKTCRLFAAVHAPNESLFEICAEIQLTGSAALKTPQPNSEYSHFEWVKKENIQEFCHHPGRTFVPLSLWMLRSLQLL